MPFSLPTLLGALIALNALTFFLFWEDKRRAVANLRRIREADLLFLAAFGGTPGAFTARHLFRHKTRKQPFSNALWAIAFVQVIAIGGMIGWIV